MRRITLSTLLLAVAAPGAGQEARPGGAATPAWLGVSYDVQWVQDRTTCVPRVMVASVVPGSPAERAGVRAGDAVVAIDGDRAPAARLPALSARLSPGDRVRLLLDRAGAAREVIVVADPRPERAAAMFVVPQPRPAQAPTGPVVHVRGDTLIAERLGAGPELPLAFARGFWLVQPDGRLTFRGLAQQPESDLDRRAVELLRCAEMASPAAGTLSLAPIVDVERIQERRDSLRMVIARRAFEHREAPGAVRVRAGVAVPELSPAGPVFRAEDALIATLRGVAGAELVAMEPALAAYFRGVDGGLLVLRVTPGTPADRSGLQPGDVITAAGGRPVTTPAEFRSALTSPEAGPVSVAVVRQGRARTLSLTRP